MALFLVERRFAEGMDLGQQAEATLAQASVEAGTDWLFSFLSPERRKTYCLYEAPNGDAIREAARRAGFSADIVMEVGRTKPPSL